MRAVPKFVITTPRGFKISTPRLGPEGTKSKPRASRQSAASPLAKPFTPRSQVLDSDGIGALQMETETMSAARNRRGVRNPARRHAQSSDATCESGRLGFRVIRIGKKPIKRHLRTIRH